MRYKKSNVKIISKSLIADVVLWFFITFIFSFFPIILIKLYYIAYLQNEHLLKVQEVIIENRFYSSLCFVSVSISDLNEIKNSASFKKLNGIMCFFIACIIVFFIHGCIMQDFGYDIPYNVENIYEISCTALRISIIQCVIIHFHKIVKDNFVYKR